MNVYENRPQPNSTNTDEIDLIALCAILWEGKRIIIAIVLLCMLPAAIWLQWQSPIYKLEAFFGSTSSYDIQALQPTPLDTGARYAVKQLESDTFYQYILAQAGSLNAQKRFWEEWSKQSVSEDPSKGVSENDVEFKNFFTSLNFIQPNVKNPNATVSQLSLDTSNPSRDIAALTAYIDFLNAVVVKHFSSQLEKAYASNIQQLELDFIMLQNREQQRLDDQLLQLQESLSLAHSLNIVDTPYEQLTGIELKVIDDRQYLLGTRVLAEEIKSLQARAEKPLSAFVPELRNMEYWRKTLESDLKKLRAVKNDIQVINLTSPVVSSLDPIKPKKLLILLGVLFGSALIGVVVSFIVYAVKNHSDRSGKVSK